MISRYPHTAVIRLTTQSNDPIPVISTTEFTIEKGRYEPANGIGGGSNTLNYSAKFFCPVLDQLKETPHLLNGQKMVIDGREIGISSAWNYQSHCAIWLD